MHDRDRLASDSFDVRIELLIAGSSQFLISPRKILASVGPSMVSSPGLMPSRLTTGTMPPITIGNWARPRFVELLARQWRVGGAEGHGLGLDLLDAAARADRLVVQSVAGFLFVGIGPLGINRIGKVAPAPEMSAALAGTNAAAAATTPAAASAVQCFKGSLHVCGQRRTRAESGPVVSVSTPNRSGCRCCSKKSSPRQLRTFLFRLRAAEFRSRGQP